MTKGLDAVLILVILLPGFLSAAIVRLMTAKSEQTEFERIIEALILSLAIYVVYFLIWRATPPLQLHAVSRAADPNRYNQAVLKIVTVAATAFALGVCWGAVRVHDLNNVLLRKLHLSSRTKFDSVWTGVLAPYSGWVQVGLSDGRSVVGWLVSSSEVGEEKTIYLERAAWIVEGVPPAYDQGDYEGNGMLLTAKAKIQSVILLGSGK